MDINIHLFRSPWAWLGGAGAALTPWGREGMGSGSAWAQSPWAQGCSGAQGSHRCRAGIGQIKSNNPSNQTCRFTEQAGVSHTFNTSPDHTLLPISQPSFPADTTRHRQECPQGSFWGQVTAGGSQGAARIPHSPSNSPTERFCTCQVTQLAMLLCTGWFSDRNSLSRAFLYSRFDAGCVHRDRSRDRAQTMILDLTTGRYPGELCKTPRAEGGPCASAWGWMFSLGPGFCTSHLVPAQPFCSLHSSVWACMAGAKSSTEIVIVSSLFSSTFMEYHFNISF